MSKRWEALGGQLGLPGDLLGDVPRLTLTGNSQALVENHKELLSYTEEAVELGCGKLRLRIRGEGLRLQTMDREELLVAGRIFSVEVDGA